MLEIHFVNMAITSQRTICLMSIFLKMLNNLMLSDKVGFLPRNELPISHYILNTFNLFLESKTRLHVSGHELEN